MNSSTKHFERLGCVFIVGVLIAFGILLTGCTYREPGQVYPVPGRYGWERCCNAQDR